MLALGPYQEFSPGTWHPPLGARSVLSLHRPAENVGLFEFAGAMPSEYRPLAKSPSEQLDEATTAVLGSAAGAKRLASGTLADCVWRLLTVHADPAGESMAPPLLPGVDGRVELHLAGRQRRMAWADLPPDQLRAVLDLQRRHDHRILQHGRRRHAGPRPDLDRGHRLRRRLGYQSSGMTAGDSKVDLFEAGDYTAPTFLARPLVVAQALRRSAFY